MQCQTSSLNKTNQRDDETEEIIVHPPEFSKIVASKLKQTNEKP